MIYICLRDDKMADLNLNIKDFGQIYEANIEIDKINVVCGVNSCGKSTISKLLYCYLKSEIDDESLDYLLDSEGLGNLKYSDIVFK